MSNLKKKKGSAVLTVLKYVLLVLWALIVLFPFYWMVLTSLKGYADYNSEATPAFFWSARLRAYSKRADVFDWKYMRL